jgi:para-nitrobenzyl esterase
MRVRSFAGGLLAAILAAGIQVANALPVEKPLPPVDTTGGRLAGLVLPSGVKAWLGVPYATPPTGSLRWRPPEAFQWRGTWNADRMMPECVQVLRAHDINHYYGEEPTSEDCLYLNVWAPATAHRGSKLPVIVYVYGGGFTIGSAGMPTYGGEVLSQRGVVFVNLNYRVGVLGFLAHPELSKEQGGHSGNYGLLDQSLALKWIHDNVERFGGDPARILVVGQSAGAGSVAMHLISPQSKGLFSRAMMSSGCNFNTDITTLADGERNGLEIQKYLGAGSLAELRNLSADRFVAAQVESQIGVTVTKGVRAGPVLDGLFLTRPFRATLEAHAMTDVPLIANFNKEESASPFINAVSVDEYRGIARRIYGADADAFLALYPAKDAADIRATGIRVAREGGLERNSRGCAQLQSQFNRSKTYVSLFSRHHAFVPGVRIADYDVPNTGAYHTGDIPFWFGTLDVFNRLRHTRQWGQDDYTLASRMMDALVAFASTGDPSTKQTPWPAWEPGSERKLEWGGAGLAEVVPINTTGIDWLAAHPALRFDRLPPSLGARD